MEQKNWRKKDQYGYVGPFSHLWNNPPLPFNPDFDPKAEVRFKLTTASLERDNYYANHTREECKAEWRRRYEAYKASGN